MEFSLAYDNTKPWGDMLYEEQQTRKQALLEMSQPEWLAYVNASFTALRGNGPALLSALSWFQQMEVERAAVNTSAAQPDLDDMTRNWRVWMDMVEHPEAYGSDIGEWLALDEELRRGPKRWRVDAYWNGKVRELHETQAKAAAKIQALWRGVKARQHFACGHCEATPLVAAEWDDAIPGLCKDCTSYEAATRIQALWRGHALRDIVGPRFTCARCLAHGVCPTQGVDDDTWFCAECTVEMLDEAEVEPPICHDCGDSVDMYGAMVGDLFLCPECIHDWNECSRCSYPVRLGQRCERHCVECGDNVAEPGDGFCCGDCRAEYVRASWKED